MYFFIHFCCCLALSFVVIVGEELVVPTPSGLMSSLIHVSRVALAFDFLSDQDSCTTGGNIWVCLHTHLIHVLKRENETPEGEDDENMKERDHGKGWCSILFDDDKNYTHLCFSDVRSDDGHEGVLFSEWEAKCGRHTRNVIAWARKEWTVIFISGEGMSSPSGQNNKKGNTSNYSMLRSREDCERTRSRDNRSFPSFSNNWFILSVDTFERSSSPDAWMSSASSREARIWQHCPALKRGWSPSVSWFARMVSAFKSKMGTK